jgi:hypothetical protein
MWFNIMNIFSNKKKEVENTRFFNEVLEKLT